MVRIWHFHHCSLGSIPLSWELRSHIKLLYAVAKKKKKKKKKKEWMDWHTIYSCIFMWIKNQHRVKHFTKYYHYIGFLSTRLDNVIISYEEIGNQQAGRLHQWSWRYKVLMGAERIFMGGFYRPAPVSCSFTSVTTLIFLVL